LADAAIAAARECARRAKLVTNSELRERLPLVAPQMGVGRGSDSRIGSENRVKACQRRAPIEL